MILPKKKKKGENDNMASDFNSKNADFNKAWGQVMLVIGKAIEGK